MKLSRKQFVLGSLGLAVVGLAGCGGDDPNPNPNPNPNPDAGTPDAGTPDSGTPDAGNETCADGTTDEIAGNHGHELTVSQADVEAAAEKSYDITGDADHPHTVTLTAAHFATLADGGEVTVTSTTDNSHSHAVTVRCA